MTALMNCAQRKRCYIFCLNTQLNVERLCSLNENGENECIEIFANSIKSLKKSLDKHFCLVLIIYVLNSSSSNGRV